MAWADGISKQLTEYFESIREYGEKAIEVIKEQIDLEVEIVRAELERTAPQGATLGLLQSLTKAKLTARRNWYGYSVTFEGTNSRGVPYQKIANILNYGTSNIKGTRFISRAIHKLKGMDDRIAERFERLKN